MKQFLAGAALVLLVFGAAMTVKHVATDVRKAIGWHLVRNQVIREANGLVGLLDWPEDRFK